MSLTRRDLLGGVPALFVLGCRSAEALPAACNDTTGLTADEVNARATLAYVDASTQSGKDCVSCQQYLTPNAAGACGTCKLLKGPVHPHGYCKAFVSKA